MAPPGGEVGEQRDAYLFVFVQTPRAWGGGGTSLRFSCSLSPGGGGSGIRGVDSSPMSRITRHQGSQLLLPLGRI